jgi:hypothetical protein
VLARTDGKGAARENNMVQASCHCGAVQLTIADAPIEVTDCNCTICRRYGALWAYYTRDKIAIAGSTDVYQRSEKGLEFHRCTRCGCITHWDPASRRWGGPLQTSVASRASVAPSVAPWRRGVLRRLEVM